MGRETCKEGGLNDKNKKREESSSANKMKKRKPSGAGTIVGEGSFERSHRGPDFWNAREWMNGTETESESLCKSDLRMEFKNRVFISILSFPLFVCSSPP